MTFSAWTFGAPVTEPGGKAARTRPAPVVPARTRARTSRDEVPDAGVRLGRGSRPPRRCRTRRPARGRCAEVDDHHVLRRVLGRAQQRLGPRLARRGALDRRGRHDVARAAQEQLGGEAQHGTALAQVEERAVARVERGGRGRRTRRRRCRRKRASRRSHTFAWKSSPAAIRSTHSATAATWRPRRAPGRRLQAASAERPGRRCRSARAARRAAAARARRAPRTTRARPRPGAARGRRSRGWRPAAEPAAAAGGGRRSIAAASP